MKEVTIWHNTKCSKSRATLTLLGEHGNEPRIVHYLDDSPSANEVERVLDLLGSEPRALMRTKEDLYLELLPTQRLSFGEPRIETPLCSIPRKRRLLQYLDLNDDNK